MARHLLIGILIALLSGIGGCAKPGLSVRSERGQAVMVDLQRVRPVEYQKEDLHEAMEPFAGHLAALVLQWEGRLRLRSSASSPMDPLVDAYLSWCARRGVPGDCLDLQDARTPGLSSDAKRTIALRVAMAAGLQEAAEVIRNVNPVKVEALLVIWFTLYLASFVFPDATVTKVIFVIMSANMIAFLGVDGFRNIIQGYREMAKAADVAQTFTQLEDAGREYGGRMGPSMLRIVTALVTWGLSAMTGMPTPVRELPGGDLAAANAEAMGFQLAAVSGGSVAVSTSGAVTLTLAMQGNVPERGGAGAVYAGQDGEAAVRAVANIGPKEPIDIDGRSRIPDGINHKTKVLTEVKNVHYLSYTRQLRDLSTWARRNGYRLDLWVRRTTKLSEPLLEEVNSRKSINLRYIP